MPICSTDTPIPLRVKLLVSLYFSGSIPSASRSVTRLKVRCRSLYVGQEAYRYVRHMRRHVTNFFKLVGRKFFFQSGDVLDDVSCKDDFDATSDFNVACLTNRSGLGDLGKAGIFISLM
jgi:hypothetical protein